MLDSHFLAWLAGFTDGEGYIDLDSSARIVWTTTHRPTLEFIQDKIEGAFRELQFAKGSRKPRYQLALYGPRARAILRAMLPWLREKRAQAELVLTYIPTPHGLSRSRAMLDSRAAIRIRLKEMRHEPS